LNISLTYKGKTRHYDPDRLTKVPVMVQEPIDWERADRTLAKFDPEIIRRLTCHPELTKTPPEVSAFFNRTFSFTVLLILINIILEFMMKMKCLESLTVDVSFLSLRAVREMSHLKELHVLGALTPISVTEHLNACLMVFKRLEKLSYNCGMTTATSYPWNNADAIKNLTWLQIREINTQTMSIKNLGKLTQLKKLTLERAYIDDDSFPYLSTLTNLEVLSLLGLQAEIPPTPMQLYQSFATPPEIGNPNPLSGLRHLTSLSNLTYLDISEVRPPRGEDEDEENERGYVFDAAELVKHHFTNLKSINIAETEIGRENEAKLRAIKGLKVKKNKWNLSNIDLILYEDRRASQTKNIFDL
jgi:hypothetical protein